MLPTIFPLLLSIILLCLDDVSQAAGEITMEQAARYLGDYGYLKTGRSTLALGASPNESNQQHHPVISIRDAIISFQKFTGLKPTGKLDAPTRKKMQQKRCGRPDIMALRRRGDYKWEKNDLTYSIDSYPNELSEREIRKAMKQAFDMWSAVTPLKLDEVIDSADITIAFARRDHNDPWPFDGRGGVLAHATLPPSGMIHFDSDEKWEFMNPKAISSYETTDILPVAIHEIGHALGLEHSADSDSIMVPFYRETVDHHGAYIMPKLSASDIKNIQYLYGSSSSSPTSSSSSNGRSFWDRIKGFFGSSSNTDTSSNSPHDSDFRTDSLDGNDDNSNSDKNMDFTCPNEVDAVINADGTNYLFSNSYVYEFDRTGIRKEYSLKRIFPNGPPYVQGALSNPRSGRTLLFQGKKVFAYQYEPNKSKFVLESNYPKRLPSDLDFKPMGAFLWTDGSQILLNGNHFATFDENWNRITLRNEVTNYFDKFPAEPIRGVLIQRTKVLLFGDKKVYKYDRRENKVIGEPTPLKIFLRCQ